MPKLDWTDPAFITTVSGAIAGGITATFVCPLDVLKTRLQVQQLGSAQYNGVLSGLATIVREEGMRGIYRGLSPTLLALLPNWAVYFTAYEHLKQKVHGAVGDRVPPSVVHLAAASGAGASTLVITNPLWVVKTRLQTQHLGRSYGLDVTPTIYRGTFDALRRIVREEGVLGLYNGLVPSLMGIAHVAIQFPLYEATKSHLAGRRGTTSDSLNISELILASAASKMVASTATYPHEVIRSHMHVSKSSATRTLSTVCTSIYKEHGMRGFYRGCLTNLLRTTPAAAITFTSFELITRYLKALAVTHNAQKDEAASQV